LSYFSCVNRVKPKEQFVMQGIRRILFVCLLLAFLPKLAIIISNSWLFFLLYTAGGTLVIVEFLVLIKRMQPNSWKWKELLQPLIIAGGMSFIAMTFLPKKVNEFSDSTGRYTLVVYQKFKFLSVPGDGGSFKADLRLYNCWGWEIDKSERKEPIHTDELSIRWRTKGVEYGKARAPLTFSN
jgi:hypothetical protein